MLKKSIKTLSIVMFFGAVFSIQIFAQESGVTPTQTETDQARQSGPCSDPWITIAFKRNYNRAPIGAGNIGECNIYLFNSGSWDGYQSLYSYVKIYVNAMNQGNVKMGYVKTKDLTDIRVAIFDGATQIGLDPNNIAKLISKDTAGLISGNGGTLISGNGGTFSVISSSSYSVQSGAKKVIKLGKTSIVVK